MDIEIMEYKEAYGALCFQDGFLEELKGKSIEEQLNCYAWSTVASLGATIPYKDVESYIKAEPCRLNCIEPIDNKTIITKDDLVVGVAVKRWKYSEKKGDWEYEYLHILPYESYCYDSSSDNNGGGYKSRDWYKTLICLPGDHTLWK